MLAVSLGYDEVVLFRLSFGIKFEIDIFFNIVFIYFK